MGYFVAYRHTGASPERLEELLPAIVETFRTNNVDTYCTYFEEAEFQNKSLGPRAIMEHAFNKIEEIGGLFVVVDGPEKSDGQLMEVGYCLAKSIPIVVAKNRSVGNSTYLDRMTDNSFEYDEVSDLKEIITRLCITDINRGEI